MNNTIFRLRFDKTERSIRIQKVILDTDVAELYDVNYSKVKKYAYDKIISGGVTWNCKLVLTILVKFELII